MVNLTPHKRRSCRRCGEPVDVFCDEGTGLWRELEITQLPITADLMDPEIRYEIFELGPTGWHSKFCPAGRNWRELRKVHTCAGQS